MAINVDSPFGSTSNNFVRTTAVTWDPRLTVPANVPGTGPLIGNNLTMTAITAGSGLGACVPTRFSQSSGDVYFEATWTSLLGSPAAGIGLINIEALLGVRSVADLALVYAALAADGTNGIILRPDGAIWAGGIGGGTSEEDGYFLHSQAELDTVGIQISTDPEHLEFLFINVHGVGGSCSGFSAGTFQIPAGSYVPAVVFGTTSAFDAYAVTAHFAQDGAFLGEGFDFTLGWPQ